MDTPEWFNTVDATPPTSRVTGLPATQSSPSFAVNWQGSDSGAGIRDYTIYVSDNGGAFTVWQKDTTASQAVFTGVVGHTYGFYSIARDLVGNVESSKTVAEAATRIVTDSTPPVIIPSIAGTSGTNGWYKSNVTISWSVSDPESGIFASNGCTTTTLTADTAGTTLTCSAVNGVGLSNSASLTVKIDKTMPTISGLPATGCVLWPPEHKLVQVATVTAGDSLSGLASFNVTGTSNEPENGLGDGDMAPDIVVAGTGVQPRIVQLRAERSGTGKGRIYTLTATATDLAGNTATSTATCTVPLNQVQR
jgi:hypothetical protein